MAHLLLIEDEKNVASFISQGLEEEGHLVTWVENGLVGLETAVSGAFDLILLDVRLPYMDGYEVARRLRLHQPDVPILMLTALNAVENRVKGLQAGADDYLAKPFAFEELSARIDALLRRSGRNLVHTEVGHGDLKIQPTQKRAFWKENEMDLTITEFDLLAYLVARESQSLSREDILRDVWGERFDRGTNVIDVYVSYLRQKLDSVGCPFRIESVSGVGYRFSSGE
ncbi:response regulator transcription factor [bacterium]|nr:response regulator transcription factor [bacterium]